MKEKLLIVSIVLPTHNGARHIRQSIDSCLGQTYKNIELIIVNDGSTDNTNDIVLSYDDKRIRYYEHKRNMGLPHAINTGFANANGDYFTWASDDNFYNNNAIEKMYAFLQEKNCSFVYCDYFKFNDNNESETTRIKLPEIPELGKGNQIGACFLYSREIWKTIGYYDPETIMAEDWDYWIRVSKKFPMHHLAEPLCFYRVHSKSLYVSRFYEAKITGILVRVKHRILSVESAVNACTGLIGNKYPGLHIINRIIAKIFFAKKITSALEDLQFGKASFKDVKLILSDIMTKRCLIKTKTF